MDNTIQTDGLKGTGRVELPPKKARSDKGTKRKKPDTKSAASSLIDVLAALDGQPLEAQERILRTALVYCGLDGKGRL